MTLQPCKQCGGAAVVDPYPDMGVSIIQCTRCRAYVAAIGRRNAEAEWNKQMKESTC